MQIPETVCKIRTFLKFAHFKIALWVGDEVNYWNLFSLVWEGGKF